MIDELKSNLTITSSDEFEAVLVAIVELAVTAGVDVGGAWEYRSDGTTHDWEINITRLATNLDEDGEQEES